MCVASMYVCLPHVHMVVQRSDILELEFRVVVNHHVGARNQNQVLSMSNRCSYREPFLQPQ